MIDTSCPNCGTEQELHSVVEAGTTVHPDGAAMPDVGSLSLCANCLGFSVFDENGNGGLYRRKPSNTEWRDILGDEQVMRVYEVASMLKRMDRQREQEQQSS